MQGHIVVIGTDRDDNWDVAKEHRLWASSRGQHVVAGDLLFFWQAGGPGLRHVARATTDGERVAADEVLPWEDDVVYDYKWKFGLEVLVDSADVDATWSDVQDALGNRSRPNHAVLQLPNEVAVKRLRRLFPGMDDAPSAPPAAPASDPPDAVDLDWPEGYDERDQVVRAVAVRRGQRAFRQALISAYDGACAMTGCQVEAVLEAAHISPYRGDKTNDARNGLLLRADVHTLFDLHLVTVLPVGVIRTSPDLTGSEYEDLDERLLRKPSSTAVQPDRGRLQEHNDRCIWLT